MAPDTAADLEDVVAEIDALIEKRDKLIVKRQEQGAPLRQIADEAGMHHSGVAKVIKRKRETP